MKRILIVVDMQRDFVDGALGTPEAQAIVPAAAAKIRAFDGDIYVTLDTHFDNYMNTSEGRHLPVPHCIRNTPGWRLNDEINAALAGRRYTVVEKPSFGSLELPKLSAESMTGDEEMSIDLIGLCTDICVVSNALMLKANFPEADIRVDAACCAGVTPEKHSAALETMRSCQIGIE